MPRQKLNDPSKLSAVGNRGGARYSLPHRCCAAAPAAARDRARVAARIRITYLAGGLRPAGPPIAVALCLMAGTPAPRQAPSLAGPHTPLRSVAPLAPLRSGGARPWRAWHRET